MLHLEDAIHHPKEADLRIVVHMGEAHAGEVMMDNLFVLMAVERLCMIMAENDIGAVPLKGLIDVGFILFAV